MCILFASNIAFIYVGATTYCIDFEQGNQVQFSDDEEDDEEQNSLIDWEEDEEDFFDDGFSR